MSRRKDGRPRTLPGAANTSWNPSHLEAVEEADPPRDPRGAPAAEDAVV